MCGMILSYGFQAICLPRLTVIEAGKPPCAPNELFDPLTSALEPRHGFCRITFFNLLTSPNAERVITSLREGQNAFAKGQEASSPDWR